MLAQPAEIHLGEGVARNHAAMRQNPLAAFGQARIIRPNSHQLGRGIALDRERDIARPAGIDAPTAVLVLVAHHLGKSALQPARIAAFQLRMQIDVICLEHRIGFQFPAPIPVGMLLREQELARAHDGRLNLREVRIQPPKPGHRDLRLNFMSAHAISNASEPIWDTLRDSSSPDYFTGTASAPAVLLPIACTISGGRPKRTFSGMTSTSSTLPKPFCRK